MANDTNQVVLIGRLTREAETSYANSGIAIAKFSLAVGEKYKDKENTSFFNCVLFGKTAENLITYLTKGKQVCVIGKLKQDRWEKDGAKKSSVSIVVNSLQFLQNGKDEQKPKESFKQGGPESFQQEDILF